MSTAAAAPSSPRKRHAPHSIARWRHRCLELILKWERTLRWVFVVIPTVLFDRIDGMDKVVSFFFVYVMLQALAILWGFLFNIGAILGGNLISILTMPYLQALCVTITHASVIGIVLLFGRAMWILTWQSTENFPMIRRIIAYECRPQSVIIATALPMLALVGSLIVVPALCVQPDQESVITESSSSWTRLICEESYLKFLTDRHPMFQRSLRLATAIAIWQFIQACLEIMPRWKGALTGLSTAWTFALAASLLLLNAIGGLWLVEWVARHFRYRVTPLNDLTLVQWEAFGLTILTAWILWFLLLTSQTTRNVTHCQANQRKLTGLFERLKYSFLFGQGIIFVRACVHPSMGFVHAQLELTIVNLLLPSIYVISLVELRMMSQLSMRAIVFSAPFALILASVVFAGSGMSDRPQSFFVVALFLFDMALRWSKTVPAFPGMDRIQYLLQDMLQRTITATSKPPAGHGAVKKMVYVAFGLLFVFITVLAGFSTLSVLQQTAQWFPDATSVSYPDNSTVEIQHTAIVKLHLGLANTTQAAMHVDQPRYASCSSNWNGLSLVDFALLAEAAYFDPVSTDVERFISTVFSDAFGDDIEVRLPELNTKTGSKLDFYEAYIPALNTSVISVRGTDIWRFSDFIEDVKMFIEPVIFSVLSAVFPTIRIWPDVTFSTLIELYSELISLFGLRADFWYYHELLAYVESIQDHDVVLTGHSMGGGIARLVGSIVGKTSVTFSPPGFVQSYSKLVHEIGGRAMKVNRANLHHRSVAVVPEYDPITMIDAQAGMVQKVTCNTPHLSMQLSCHMLEGTLCNLLEHCGDRHDRIASCQFEHHIASLKDDLLPKLSSVLLPETMVTVFILAGIVLSTLIRHRQKPSARAQFMNEGTRTSGRSLPGNGKRRGSRSRAMTDRTSRELQRRNSTT